jgi:adenylate kinase
MTHVAASRTSSLAFGVFGISGVGKTSLIARAVQRYDTYFHVQASELIKAGLPGSTLSSELLRKSGRDQIIENQSILVRMFEEVRKSNFGKVVVLDAHSLVDTGDQTISIPVAIIRDLQLAHLIFMRDLPNRIVSRREQDRSRVRPQRTVAEIASLQEQALDLCQEYAYQLRLPLNVVSAEDECGLALALTLRRSPIGT